MILSTLGAKGQGAEWRLDWGAEDGGGEEGWVLGSAVRGDAALRSTVAGGREEYRLGNVNEAEPGGPKGKRRKGQRSLVWLPEKWAGGDSPLGWNQPLEL